MILGGGWRGCHSCPIRPGTPVMFTSISWSSHNNFFKVSLFTFIFSSPLPQLSILVEFLMKALATWWHWGVCWPQRGLGATQELSDCHITFLSLSFLLPRREVVVRLLESNSPLHYKVPDLLPHRWQSFQRLSRIWWLREPEEIEQSFDQGSCIQEVEC